MKMMLILAVTLGLGASGCKKKDEATPAQGPAGPAGATGPTGATGPVATPDAAPSPAERAASSLAEAQAEIAADAKRFTPELAQQITALRDATYPGAKEALTAILAGPHRVPGHADRDPARHPLETLTFFGIDQSQTVIELGAGEGWYTELLAPLLAGKGKLVAVGPDAAGPADKMSTVYGKRLDLLLAKSPELFGKVERRTIHAPDHIVLGDPGTADLVIAIREMHNWQRNGALDKYLAAIHAVLKDGATFGVVAHRAAEGAKAETTAEQGYLPEAWVIEKVTAAGFELGEKSEINANPKDTKDYKGGVWTLPPNYREGETDKAKYAAIGESDRMTLRFKKMAGAAPVAPAGGAAPDAAMTLDAAGTK